MATRHPITGRFQSDESLTPADAYSSGQGRTSPLLDTAAKMKSNSQPGAKPAAPINYPPDLAERYREDVASGRQD
jgi:hypothetical protein